MNPGTPIDEKLFDNIFRFVAVCVTADEYYFHIAEGLITIDLDLVRKEYEAKHYHPNQIRKIIERREKELRRIHENKKKFFADFVKKFNQPQYSKLTDAYVDKLHAALNTISYKDANNPTEPTTDTTQSVSDRQQ